MIRIILIFLAILVPATSSAQSAEEARPLRARGMIIARQQPVISSEIAARITSLPVREGDYFKKGALLVAFDNQLLKAQRDRTAAELEAARLKLANSRQLEQLESIGALEVALAETEVKRRTAEMAITDISLQRCTISAPFNGRVVSLYVNEHESMAPQQKLLEIVSTDQLEVEIMIPSDWLSWVHNNTPFTLNLDALSIQTTAYVTAVGATVDPVSKTVRVRGRLNKHFNNLLPGMTATVLFQNP
ncbi:MAG: efflux RND transporter periplasmic adaptor subunit [Desulfoplanes sp.]